MTVSMITARTLSALPGMVAAECGENRLSFVCEQAGLPASLPENLHKEFYFPQLALLRFVDAAGRELGLSCIGLAAAHQMTVRDYGIWGDYILAAPSLRTCFKRAMRVFETHSTGDTFNLVPGKGGLHVRYRSAVAGSRSFENISYIGFGVIKSVVNHYAGKSWRPDKVTLDYAETRRLDQIEETLGSKVRFGAEYVSFFIPDHILDLANPTPQVGWKITASDVIRARLGRSPVTVTESVRAMVRLAMLESAPNLDRIAIGLGMGLRTLQRRLDRDSTSFRRIVEEVTMERAVDLLNEPDVPVTRIATALGYSSPSHFSRAFRRGVGISPTAFRQNTALLGYSN